MMTTSRQPRLGAFLGSLLAALCLGVLLAPASADARNVSQFSDTISNSAPEAASNHTFRFTLGADIPASTVITVVPGPGFSVTPTSTFSVRNVEMIVNGLPRSATGTPSGSDDGVSITGGSPGQISYTLNSSAGLSSGDEIELRIGNHTSESLGVREVYDPIEMASTTLPADAPGIFNPNATGTHTIRLTAIGADVSTDFVIAIIDSVGIGVDTTEDIPPFRFNGSPTSTVGGTTLFVEISLETDEFSRCRYSTASGTPYASMVNNFNTSNEIIHVAVAPVVLGEFNQFFVRCIDDEDNINTDDYLIAFTVNPPPTGTANDEGSVEGDGTGSGDTGSGTGSGSGGTQGQADGGADTVGTNSGGGGSGGGSGRSGAGDGGTGSGGGFESGTFPYESGDGEVIISGYASPNSDVFFLVDGAIALRTTANSSGRFEETIEEIARGVYTFGVYAVDDNNVRSTTFSTSFTVSGARRSSLSNVNVAPSLQVEPDPVDPGETLTVSGYTLPNANVTIENDSDISGVSATTFTATSNSSGFFSQTISTAGFQRGTYKVRARAVQTEGLGVNTNFSDYTFYGVGEAASLPNSPDLNRDGSVNLTDFSIMLFWWGTDGGASNPPADINSDGTVSLTDFSILLFNWTG